MKTQAFILLLVFSIAICARGNERDALVWHPFSELADVQCGDSREKVIATLGYPASQSERFLDYTELGFSVVLTESGKVYSFACGSGCDLDRILAKRFKYKTDKGIGMNSSEEEITSAYGQPDRRKETAEGDLQVYYKNLNPRTLLVFILDEQGVRNIHSANLNIK